MFLITGITGNVGGAAARQLLSQGKQLRALVRNPAKAASWNDQGVELVEGDVNDAAAITRALQGVEAAFLMMPPSMTPSPGFPEAKAIVAAYTEALGNAPPPRIVMLSSIGSEKTERLGLITSTSLLERALEKLATPVAFVRAGSFLENFLFGLESGKGGVLPTFYAPVDRKFPMIATADIGAQVASLLTSDWTGRRIIELGSFISPEDLATAIGEALGNPVQAHPVPREAWSSNFEAMGFPAGSGWAYEEMSDSVNSGWIAFNVEGTEKVEGTTTPRQFFAAAKGA